MGETLGLIASVGMLLLIFALLLCFFREMGWMGERSFLLIRRAAGMTLGMGCGYWLLGALIFQVNYGVLPSVAQLEMIFRGPYLQGVFQGLYSSVPLAPVSGLFVFMARGLGQIMFGQYMLSGVTLAWVMTGTGLWLFQLTLEKIFDEKRALDIAFLIPCLPGAFFFFLPGCAPVLLVAVSLILFLFRNRFKKWERPVFFPWFGWTVAACTLFSAAVTAASVFGTLG